MPRISREDYCEFHESAESLRDERDVHPRLRPRNKDTDRCRACGRAFIIAGLTDDGLCEKCDKTVKDLEEGKI